MFVPPPIIEAVEGYIGSKVLGFVSVSGGCINEGGKITTSTREFFVKWNGREEFPGMFDAEGRGLTLLRQSNTLAVPDVIQCASAGSYQFLLLEYIKTGSRSRDYWRSFGRGLAALHKKSSASFGLDHDNYIGSLPQPNKPGKSWLEFFVSQRLEVQLRIALQSNALDQSAMSKFTRLFDKLPSLIPHERPSLLHGDLWGGNVMITGSGQPCLIDPAVYYGHREVDLAMTQLFGGFDGSFFEGYGEVYPLLPGYRERFDLYNLYPLLVHVNLFGGGYRSQVMSVLNRFM